MKARLYINGTLVGEDMKVPAFGRPLEATVIVEADASDMFAGSLLGVVVLRADPDLGSPEEDSQAKINVGSPPSSTKFLEMNAGLQWLLKELPPPDPPDAY